MVGFWLVTVSFLHTESNVKHLLKAPVNTFLHQQAVGNLRGRYGPKTEKKMQIFSL